MLPGAIIGQAARLTLAHASILHACLYLVFKVSVRNLLLAG